MAPQYIRPISIGIFQKENSILVFEGYDKVDKETFYRPLGGGIEFGEHSSDTLKREIKEEMNAEIRNLKFLGTIENIFVHLGLTGHEIVQVYSAEFCDERIYRMEKLLITEDDGSQNFAYWKPLEEFQNNRLILYPAGLLELL